jgi:sulfate adenylyltransferase
MPRPHGGKLISRQITDPSDNFEKTQTCEITTDQSEDVINIANGVFSPLQGFVNRNDLDNIVTKRRLENDVPWTIPIILDTDDKNIKEGDSILMTNKETGLRAIIDVEDKYKYSVRLKLITLVFFYTII